jgi:hypothetical protein
MRNEQTQRGRGRGRIKLIIIIIIIRGVETDYVYYGGDIKFTTPQPSGLCPLVLQVKVSWRQGKALGREGETKGNGLFEYAAKTRH